MLQEVITPTVGIRHQQENTVAYVGETELGKGCLYITESLVAWMNDAGRGFTLNYPSISLHAISRDTTAFCKPCFYIMFDGKLEDSSDENKDSSCSEDDEPEIDPVSDITEVRFVPEDLSSLDAMYSTLCDCQVLHPDPDDSFSDDDEYEAPDNEVTEAGDCINDDDGGENHDSDTERKVGAVHNHHENGNAMETETTESGQFDDVDE